MRLKKFGASSVIKEHIKKEGFSSFLVGFDINDNGEKVYRLDEFVELLIDVIPEFAIGLHDEPENTSIVRYLRDAAKSIYSVDTFQKARDLYLNDGEYDDEFNDKYLRRGEFGELILHLVLRDFFDTIPLLSKIYFKDSYGSTVHGFDAVHINPDEKTLWLGESKIYTDGKKGIKSLIDDLSQHITSEYIKDEFILIRKKIKGITNISGLEYWQNTLSSISKLSEKLSYITIPLLCVYESPNFSKFSDELDSEFILEYEKEVKSLFDSFHANNNHPLKDKLNIIILLFPIQSKKRLVKRLHKNLSLLQEMGRL